MMSRIRPPAAATSSMVQSQKRRVKSSTRRSKAKVDSDASPWSVYLIISTYLPKTYVGVTTDFSRRLKQHNGELKGGAKASSAGRPWSCACIVRGFKDRSEACEFEWKWKSFSRKLPRKKSECETQQSHGSLLLLQHRETALRKVKDSFDCSHLEIDWQRQCGNSS